MKSGITKNKLKKKKEKKLKSSITKNKLKKESEESYIDKIKQ